MTAKGGVNGCDRIPRMLSPLSMLVLACNNRFYDGFGAEHIALLLFGVATALFHVFYLWMSVFLQILQLFG